MPSSLDDYYAYYKEMGASPLTRQLRQIFATQARGTRLRGKEFDVVSDAMQERISANPLLVTSDISYATEGSRSFSSYFIYFAPLTSAIKPNANGRLNPHKLPLCPTGEHQVVTAKTTSHVLRTLPIHFNNEQVEMEYLRETCSTLNYSSLDMQRFLGLGLLASQLHESGADPSLKGDNTFVVFPFGEGLLKGKLITSSVHTGLVRYLPGQDRAFQTNGPQYKTDIKITHYKGPSEMTRSEATLHAMFSQEFGDPETRLSLNNTVKKYIQGETNFADDPECQVLRERLERIMESLAWLQATVHHPALMATQTADPWQPVTPV